MRHTSSLLHLLLAVPPRISGRLFSALTAALLLFGCASSGPPQLPYPAFIEVDTLDDVFMASLPGIRAKQLAGDPQLRTTSNRIDLPEAWSGTSGGSPGKSLEIFVLLGSITIADVELGPGGYAYLPAGSLGFNLKSNDGARILYFLDDADSMAMIRSPIIMDSALLDWQPTDTGLVSDKDLRADPGSGSRTWLRRVETGAVLPWESSTARREGYLVSGNYQHSECYDGAAQTWQYAPGGYFLRPGGAVNGGPEANATTETVWLLREKVGAKYNTHASCE